MSVMDTLLSYVPNGRGAARADAVGNLIEYNGQIDAESVCAVAAMSMTTLEDVGSLLGLGTARGWAIAGQRRAMYVQRAGPELVVVEAAVSKNPETVLKKIAEVLSSSVR